MQSEHFISSNSPIDETEILSIPFDSIDLNLVAGSLRPGTRHRIWIQIANHSGHILKSGRRGQAEIVVGHRWFEDGQEIQKGAPFVPLHTDIETFYAQPLWINTPEALGEYEFELFFIARIQRADMVVWRELKKQTFRLKVN